MTSKEFRAYVNDLMERKQYAVLDAYNVGLKYEALSDPNFVDRAFHNTFFRRCYPNFPEWVKDALKEQPDEINTVRPKTVRSCCGWIAMLCGIRGKHADDSPSKSLLG